MNAELFLRITRHDSKGKMHEDYYALERCDPVAGVSKLVWSLRKPDDERPRIVTVCVSGRIECDCQDYVLGRNLKCKHITALMQTGELPGWKGQGK